LSAEVFNSLLNYIRQSEKLIVVTVSITLAGVALYATEGLLIDYGGLPEWVRPTAFIVWSVCAAHVAIRALMETWNGSIALARFIAGIPQRRRQAVYDRRVVDRLLATDGVEREILCYALYRNENHVWASSQKARHPRWLIRLKQAGLLDLDDANCETAHYRIHPVAWKYMQKYPNKFVHRLGWHDWPWSIDFDQDKAEKRIEELKKDSDPKSRPLRQFFARMPRLRRSPHRTP
jgi:hypothetical protein